MSMTLWNIEQGLADLFERREELTVPEASGIESFVELQEVDLAISDYIKAEVSKVDGVRGWWKYLEMMRDAAKDEALKPWLDNAARRAADPEEVGSENCVPSRWVLK